MALLWKINQRMRGKMVNFVLGGPSSGKGTFCANLINANNRNRFAHLSAGDLLRKFVRLTRYQLNFL